ncbi:MAG: recombinase family protein [Alteromonadaceae bacterium]|nr:recombinase family protein [Alteromonadaceae bacterium]
MGHKIAIYARVSTREQNAERQLRELRAFAERGGYEVVAEVSETASGRRDSRPGRARLLAMAKRRELDAIAVVELSRWGRSTADLLSTLSELEAKRVSLLTLNGLELDVSSPMGKMISTFLAGVAEFETALLSERVKSGLEAARAKGKILGRQTGDAPTVRRYERRIRALSAEGRSQRWIAKELQISRTTVAKVLR